ncbi:MAG: hypothetical protein ABJ111_01165, partial [Alphaproteobacteria bacterium]
MTDGGDTPAAPEEGKATPTENLAGPASRKPRSRWVRFILIAAICLPLLGLALAGTVFLYGKYRFEAAGPHAESRVVMLDPGLGVRAIASRLDKAGVISDTVIFLAGVRFNRAEGDLKA